MRTAASNLEQNRHRARLSDALPPLMRAAASSPEQPGASSSAPPFVSTSSQPAAIAETVAPASLAEPIFTPLIARALVLRTPLATPAGLTGTRPLLDAPSHPLLLAASLANAPALTEQPASAPVALGAAPSVAAPSVVARFSGATPVPTPAPAATPEPLRAPWALPVRAWRRAAASAAEATAGLPLTDPGWQPLQAAPMTPLPLIFGRPAAPEGPAATATPGREPAGAAPALPPIAPLPPTIARSQPEPAVQRSASLVDPLAAPTRPWPAPAALRPLAARAAAAGSPAADRAFAPFATPAPLPTPPRVAPGEPAAPESLALAPVERALVQPAGSAAAAGDETPLPAPLPVSSPFAPLVVGAPPRTALALHHASRSAGAPLALPVRAPFERLLGASFGDVEIHTDESAASATAAAGAAAMTLGHRVFFAPGRFRPEEPEGGALLAHELTHVVQQRVAPMQMALKSLGSAAATAAETEAEQTEARVLDLHQNGAFAAQPLTLARSPAREPASTPAATETSFADWSPGGPALGTDSAPALARVTSIQRAETGSPSADGASANAATGTENGAGPNVHELADRVFALLKGRLLTERERRGHWL
jgi:hypothetical protein